MLKRLLSRLFILSIYISLSIFGFLVLKEQGTFAQIISNNVLYEILSTHQKETINNQLMEYADSENIELSDNQKKELNIIEFKIPDIYDNLLAYIHKKGLSNGKFLLKSQTEKATITQKNNKIVSVSKRLKKLDMILFTKDKPEKDTFYHAEIFDTLNLIKVTDYLYDNAIKPLNIAIKEFMFKTDSDIIMQISFTYKHEDDKIPYLINYKAFSEKDYGKTVNLNIDFYNYIPKHKINYKTGEIRRIYREE